MVKRRFTPPADCTGKKDKRWDTDESAEVEEQLRQTSRRLNEERKMADRAERELVLAPNEFTFVLDTTKGLITCYVGPHKPSLSSTDSTVLFDERKKRFVPVSLDNAVQTFRTAPENWYMVMKNPAKDGTHPNQAAANSSPGLQIGKKVNIPGPTSFALWPGQMVKVIQGHKLQSNQYLLVRIYDHDEANKNLEAIYGGKIPPGSEDLVAGQKVVIKGTDVSFYMPPTGAEVVPDDDGELVRDAVTLERLEYCVLVGENGEKAYRRGEDVVFPHPDQKFLMKSGSRKFRAIELDETSGLHVKVIAPYDDEDGSHVEGEELFITGKDKLYFPRKEHAIIRDEAGNQLHHAVAIPKGEGLYVLNKQSGDVKTVTGPKMFLPDPRTEAVTQRILSDRECHLLYPGNQEALDFNRQLRGVMEATGAANAAEAMSKVAGASRGVRAKKALALESAAEALAEIAVSSDFAGDGFTRAGYEARPKSITIDNKYRGAVSTDVWSGFAIQIIDKAGHRRVVEGPVNGVLLEYDETVEALHLSTGKPKTTDRMVTTAFLKTRNNYVSDIIGVISSDLIMAQIKVKYLVDFVGDDEAKWFGVDNYVKLLCDHARSKIKAVARKTPIREFQQNVAEIIRDTILGVKPAEGDRTGLVFDENSMVVRDVDVLHFEITQKEVKGLMFESQIGVVRDNIVLAQKEAELANQRRLEEISRALEQERHKTEELRRQLRLESEQGEHNFQASLLEMEDNIRQQREATTIAATDHDLALQAKRREARERDHELELKRKGDMQQLNVAYLKEKVDGAVKQANAFSPHVVEAVKRLGDAQLLSSLAENFGELAAIEGKGLLAVANKFLDFKHTGAMIPMLKEQPEDE
jgi:major vault protein